jgi:hypothetical protein
MDEVFGGLPGFRRVVDDVVIYDQDGTQHGALVRQFLQRCAERNITLNIKMEVRSNHHRVCGIHTVSKGYQINPLITQAIADFPTPTNHTDVRSFVGLVNQLSASTPAIA